MLLDKEERIKANSDYDVGDYVDGIEDDDDDDVTKPSRSHSFIVALT